MGVVLVMEHTGGRDLFSADGPGSVERGVYASGKDGEAGGYSAQACVGEWRFTVVDHAQSKALHAPGLLFQTIAIRINSKHIQHPAQPEMIRITAFAHQPATKK
ncbi:MAG: hypothetical protein WCX22_07180 [Methanoregula sp.]